METAASTVCTTSLLPFQIGGSGLIEKRAGQDVDDCSPFMAILKNVLMNSGGEQADAERSVEWLFCLAGETGDGKANEESIPEYDDRFPMPEGADTRQLKNIGQAILSSLAQFLKGQGEDNGEKAGSEPIGEKIEPDRQFGQETSVYEVAPEILALLAVLQDKPYQMPALPQAGKDVASEYLSQDDPPLGDLVREDGDPETAIFEKCATGERFIPEFLSAPSDVQEVSVETRGDDHDSEESNDDICPAEAITGLSSSEPEHATQSVMGGVVVPPPQEGNQVGKPGFEKTNDSQQGRLIEPYIRYGKNTHKEQAAEKQAPTRSEHSGPSRQMNYGAIHSETIDEEGISSNDPTNAMIAKPNCSSKARELIVDVSRQEKMFHSEPSTSDEGSPQTEMGFEEAQHPVSVNVVTKGPDKSEHLRPEADFEVVRVEPSSRHQSFSKGEGDSQQLGQGPAGHPVVGNASVNGSDETFSFGDIVAERIARTVEHIAQTEHSNLTLRLKIDGSESVFLEMKERAGTIIIGIQCQDKTLIKALDSQKEMMIRNLEAKNLNTSISITGVGEDESDGQRRWHHERHDQRRDNWNGRQTNTRSYFEALI